MKTNEELESSLRHCRDWWAARFERLSRWARVALTEDQKREYFSIVASGTASPSDHPNYERVLAINQHEIAALKDLVVHCRIYSGYKNCGFINMTTAQKELFEKCRQDRNENKKKPRVNDGITNYERCEKCDVNPAEPGHPCPYAEDVYNNPNSRCNCCPACRHECLMDI